MSGVIATIGVLTVVGFVLGGLLAVAARSLTSRDDKVVAVIHELLPKTQCAQCGYPGCRPYALAIANGEAINRCPPGGETLITSLANVLGRDTLPLADDLKPVNAPLVARIREPDCIGCKLCIDACPVDAIIGAPKLMHTVIEELCTGCELCLPPCPVDCIDLITQPVPAAVKPATITVPCIHCGECEPACPRSLAPQQLLMARHNLPLSESLDLDDCVVCRRCDRVCPSEIPLTAIFREMKQSQSERLEAMQFALAAEQRFEQRESRRLIASSSTKARPDDVSALLSSIGDDL